MKSSLKSRIFLGWKLTFSFQNLHKLEEIDAIILQVDISIWCYLSVK